MLLGTWNNEIINFHNLCGPGVDNIILLTDFFSIYKSEDKEKSVLGFRGWRIPPLVNCLG